MASVAWIDGNPVGHIWDCRVDGPQIPTEITASTHMASVWCVGCIGMLKNHALQNASSLSSCELLHHVT